MFKNEDGSPPVPEISLAETKAIRMRIDEARNRNKEKADKDIPLTIDQPQPSINEIWVKDKETYERLWDFATQVEGISSPEALEVVRKRMNEEVEHSKKAEKAGLKYYFSISYYVSDLPDDQDKLQVSLKPSLVVYGHSNVADFIDIADVENPSVTDKILTAPKAE